MGNAWLKKGQLVKLKDDERVGMIVEIFESSFKAPYGPWYTVYWIKSSRKEDIHQSRLLPFDDEELIWKAWGDV
tara:strand:+ start:5649 stop:5870 length:222 start_codon:yes stop_codon:yes gene_type:complete